MLAAAQAEAAGASGVDDLEAVRVRWLGRKEGRLTAVLRGLSSLPAEQRGAVGAAANRAKQVLSEALDQRVASLRAEPAAEGGLDLSMPGRREWRGGVHPVTVVIDEICDIFRGLGFTRARGPEVETDWHNFVALNTPLDHPAADEHDTMWLGPHTLLRSHTSPVQIRTMQAYEPPVRIVVPGMAYRRDPFDASHAPAFEQIEGLAVDEGITFVEFKWTLAEFARQFFGADTRTRFRPSYFPFTEPSAEVDVTCMICDAQGCSACKGTGWIEIMGAGMVDPAVFERVGYDPERYTGFAFGMGPARIAMLRYGVPDIRIFYDSDIRFLEQFAR
ncbi:MAG: phenylalanine--tRNA ligase subunit alpha [Gemmatimonadota bacterium]